MGRNHAYTDPSKSGPSMQHTRTSSIEAGNWDRPFSDV